MKVFYELTAHRRLEIIPHPVDSLPRPTGRACCGIPQGAIRSGSGGASLVRLRRPQTLVATARPKARVAPRSTGRACLGHERDRRTAHSASRIVRIRAQVPRLREGASAAATDRERGQLAAARGAMSGHGNRSEGRVASLPRPGILLHGAAAGPSGSLPTRLPLRTPG
jgi:hypothetical protein